MPAQSPCSVHRTTLFHSQVIPSQTCLSPVTSATVRSPAPFNPRDPHGLAFFSPHNTPERHENFMFQKLVPGSIRQIASGGQGTISLSLWSDDKSASVYILKTLRPLKTFSKVESPAFRAQEDLFKGEERSSRNYLLPHIAIYEHLVPFHRRTIKTTYAVFPFCENFLDKQEKMFYELHKTPLIFSFFAMQLLKDALTGLNFMHTRKKHIHGDINLSNIGVYKGTWLLIDMDCAKQFDSKATPAGHYLFKHPASFANSQQAREPFNDIYALGMVLKNLLQMNFLKGLLQKPEMEYYREIQVKRAEFLVRKDKSLSLESIKSEFDIDPFNALKNLAELMTCLDETQVPTAEVLLEVISNKPEALLAHNPEIRKVYDKYLNDHATLRQYQLNEYINQLKPKVMIKEPLEVKEIATIRPR